MGVQCAGGLVGHDDGRLGGDGPRNGHPLLLAAGHLHRPVLDAVRQPHPGQGLQGHVPAVVGIHPLVDQGQFHIFQHRQALDQVVLLKDKADLLVADVGQLLVRQLPDVRSTQEIRPPGGDVQAAQHVHHGGLAGAGLAHHRHELALSDGQGDAVQGPYLALPPFAIDLIDVPQLY